MTGSSALEEIEELFSPVGSSRPGRQHARGGGVDRRERLARPSRAAYGGGDEFDDYGDGGDGGGGGGRDDSASSSLPEETDVVVRMAQLEARVSTLTDQLAQARGIDREQPDGEKVLSVGWRKAGLSPVMRGAGSHMPLREANSSGAPQFDSTPGRTASNVRGRGGRGAAPGGGRKGRVGSRGGARGGDATLRKLDKSVLEEARLSHDEIQRFEALMRDRTRVSGDLNTDMVQAQIPQTKIDSVFALLKT